MKNMDSVRKVLRDRMIKSPNYYISRCRFCNKNYRIPKADIKTNTGYCSPTCRLADDNQEHFKMPFLKREKVRGYIPMKKKFEKESRSVKRARQKRKAADTPFFRSQKWLELRYRVFKTYPKICMCCGTDQGKMHVDHIKPRSKYPWLALEFENLQVLCADCNLGKSNKDATDFRPKQTLTEESKDVKVKAEEDLI